MMLLRCPLLFVCFSALVPSSILIGDPLIRITDGWHYQPGEAWVIEAEAENSELRAWTKPDLTIAPGSRLEGALSEDQLC